MTGWRLAALLPACALLLVCSRATGHDPAPVKREDLSVTVEATGSLRASESVSLGPPLVSGIWGFKITWIAPESREVRRGDPVLSFDSTELEREKEKKITERDRAAKEVERRRLELEAQILDLEKQRIEARAAARKARLKVEVPNDLAARVEISKARLDLEQADADVESLELRLRLAGESGRAEMELLGGRRNRAAGRVRELEAAVGKMTLRAPRDGLVVYATGRPEKWKAGDGVSVMENVIEIPDLSRMEAAGEVDEPDAGRIAAGQRVVLRLDAHPDVAHGGRVVEVAPTVRRKSWDTSLKVRSVRVALDRTDATRMRPGMRFRAEIEVLRVPGALVIPLDSVFPGPVGPVVNRVEGGKRVETPVRLGAQSREKVEVLAGLKPGDRILRGEPPDGGSPGGEAP